MNAKKIMGAVLVALLAVTAFAGVAAADSITVDLGPLPAYTDMTGVFSSGMTFSAADGSTVTTVEYDSKVYFAADGDLVNKKYSGYNCEFFLVAPTAVVSALDANGVNVIGKTVSKTVANGLTFVYNFTSLQENASLVYFDANGVKYNERPPFTPGKWGVAANLTGQVVTSAEVYGNVYYFTVAKTDATITAAKDTFNIGEKILLTIQVPGAQTANVTFEDDYVDFLEGQAGVTNGTGKAIVALGLDGTATVAFTADKKGKTTFEIEGKDVEVEVTIQKGTITAVADADSYYLGKAIALSGTTTAGDELHFYIEGTNFDFMNIDALGEAVFSEDLEVENGAWTVELDSSKIVQDPKVLIAGTYTIIVATENKTAGENGKSLKETIMSGVYGAAAVTMTQPFITDVKAAATAVQGTDYEITGTAIAAENVKLYVFGTSYFNAFTEGTDEDDAFEFTITGTDAMAPGTYFYLIQHPMNDGEFNVWNESNGDFNYAATTSTGELGNETFIFNAWKRGTNFAAQALLETIAGQDIDDIFVQGTFEVAAQKLTINPIPAEVAKGTALTISGSTNSGDGVEVIVNVLAGKFGATVKGDENSATFLTAKGVTQEDGTFEAAIDTSKLEVGSYIVTVEIAGTMYDSAAVEIVAAADEPETPVTPEQPEQPEQPEEPVAPATPGFGALAALAGLGAVAVLLLRKYLWGS